jgi:hypothetical protein
MNEMTAFAETVESRVVLAPGVHFDVLDRDYHADPCPEPSLSASLGKVLVNRSARAAQWKHPRLRPAHLPPAEEKWADQTNQGSVIHKLVLGRGKEVVEVDAKDWKTDASKHERSDIVVCGKLACLKSRLIEAKAVAAELRPHVASLGEHATEVVLIWQDRATDGTPVWCRAMLDILNEAGLIGDLKITAAELTDAFVARQVGSMSYDFSMAWYRRGLSILRPELAGRIKTRLIFAERNEPYDVFPLDLTEGNLHVADRQCQAAIDRFAACLTAGHWPGVAPKPRTLEIPDWHQRQFLEAELEGEIA